MSIRLLETQVNYDAATQPKISTMPSDTKSSTMRILIAGSGGMIGSAVTPYLASQGHAITRLVRHAPNEGQVRWDPEAGTIDTAGVEGFDGVVHFAALPQSRWTLDFVRRWRENHVGTNRLLAETLARCRDKPRVLVCASAQGIYAPSEENVLTEDSPLGTDYLADLMRAGEAATAPASDAGIRVVHLRIPTVLGGASLGAMPSNVRQLGSGKQWFSWIARDEMSTIVQHVLVTDTLEGSVNATSPSPVRNAEFFASLGRVLGRKPWLPMPAFALRLAMGDMADLLILASRRLIPGRLLDSGYVFRFPQVEYALQHELKAVV